MNEADNYTATISPPDHTGQTVFTITTASLVLTVLYNVEYTMSISATNCAGSSASSAYTLSVGMLAYSFHLLHVYC